MVTEVDVSDDVGLSAAYAQLGDNSAVGGAVRLANGEWVKGRNAANNADVNLIRVNGSHEVELGSGIVSQQGTVSDLALGTNPAQTGTLKLPNAVFVKARNAANSADLSLIRANADDEVEVGQCLVTGIAPGEIPARFVAVRNASGYGISIELQDEGGAYWLSTIYVSVGDLSLDVADGKITIDPAYGHEAHITRYVHLNNDVPPAGNPSLSGYLYSEGGALKWRGSSGTVTTIAPA